MTDIATEIVDVKPESNARGWKYFAGEINTLWHRGAGDFIKCGQLLIDAKTELEPDAFAALVKNKLHFDRSVGTKLMAIAANPILCAHAHNLPPCWSTLYELSQIKDDVLQAKFADGTIKASMLRKDALALKPKTTRTPTGNTDSSTTSQLKTAWDSASRDQRREFLDKLGRAGLCGAMSAKLRVEFEDVVVRTTGASETGPFAIYATDKLHCALRCAEQPTEENTRAMVGALGCIIKKAETKGITRSRIVIAEGKVRTRK
jgi:hypothetical protein